MSAQFIFFCLVVAVMWSWCMLDSAAAAQGKDDREIAGVRTVIDRVRAATGFADAGREPVTYLEGSAHHHGLDGRYRLWFTPDGRFRKQIECAASETVGFDGKAGWALDSSGMPRVLELEELEASQTLQWVQTGRWLAADGPFAIELEEKQADPAKAELSLHLKKGLARAVVLVDRTTYLPAALRCQSVLGDEEWTFEKYHPVHGFQLAHRLVHKQGSLVDSYDLRDASRESTHGENLFDIPQARPKDAEFHAEKSAAVELKRTATGHFFVRPKINGQDLGWFALDTGSGAGMTIVPEAAERAGMSSFGTVLRGGVGKVSEGHLRRGTTFELGPITIRNTIYVEMPQEFVATMRHATGLHVMGTCGYDLFARAVVALDQKTAKLTIHEPDTYRLPRGEWRDLTLSHRVPCVRCGFEDHHNQLFQLDTGAGPLVLFHAPAVDKLALLSGRQTSAMPVAGVGGSIDARIGQLSSFSVAGHRVENVPALFIVGRHGALTDPYTTGTFGASLLSPDQLIFDYPRRRMAFLREDEGK
jgi:predicted aspartyl protease